MSRRSIQRDGKQQRAECFQERDHDLLDALADMAQHLMDQGIDIGNQMRDELSERKAIRDTYKNSNL